VNGSLKMSQKTSMKDHNQRPTKRRMRKGGMAERRPLFPSPWPASKSGAGRPTKFSDELAAEICDRIPSNQMVKVFCEDQHMPVERTVYYWFHKHPQFLQQYHRALEVRASWMLEEILAIADNCGEHWAEKRRRKSAPDIQCRGGQDCEIADT
jgi:hypothetical protein